jgi:putative hydrolase of the HAD superfamily
MYHKIKWKLFVFDFDGVLVDSYSRLPVIYELLAERLELGKKIGGFVQQAIALEDMEDAKCNYDRRKWWGEFLKGFGLTLREAELNELLKVFWDLRIRLTTVMGGAKELLIFLRECGSKISILCGSDGQLSMKRKRIKESGLGEFFDDILVVGEDVCNRKQGFSLLFEKFKVTGKETIFIEDKPDPINEVRSINSLIGIAKVEFGGPLKLAWSGNYVSSFKIKSLVELKQIMIGKAHEKRKIRKP